MTFVATEMSACSLPAANACPNKVGNKNNAPSGAGHNRSSSNSNSEGRELTSLCAHIVMGEPSHHIDLSIASEHRIAQQTGGCAPNRPHPELDQGPADLQSIALACQPASEP